MKHVQVKDQINGCMRFFIAGFSQDVKIDKGLYFSRIVLEDKLIP